MNEQTRLARTRCFGDLGEAWTMFADAAEKLAGAHELNAIVEIVIDGARRLSRAEGASFVLREHDLCYYLDEDAIGPLWRGRRFPASECISGWCMLNRQTAIISDIDQDQRIPHDTYTNTFVKSLVMVPVGGEEPIAAIGVYWAQEQAPDPTAVMLLKALARSTATALASAASRQALVKRVDELATLYRLTDELYRAQSLSETYEAALDAIFRAVSCSRASILLFDGSGIMRFVAWRGLSEHYRNALEGHSPWKPGDRDPHAIFVGDIDATDESASVKATVGGRHPGSRIHSSRVEIDGHRQVHDLYDSVHTFVGHETDLAVTIARQVGFSVERMRAEEARLLAEQELRRSEELVRLATRTGKVGLWEWDIGLDRVTWTDSLYSIHHVDRATFDATLEGFAALVHPEDRERVSTAIEESVEEGKPYELEFRAIRPDGQVVWLFTNAVILRDSQKPVRMVGATFDLTDRKQAEERFRLAVEAAPSGMVLADSEGRIMLVNAHAEKLFGYGRDELVGRYRFRDWLWRRRAGPLTDTAHAR